MPHLYISSSFAHFLVTATILSLTVNILLAIMVGWLISHRKKSA